MKALDLENLDTPIRYKRVLVDVLSRSSYCTLTVRAGTELSDVGQRFLDDAKQEVLEVVEKSEWPGTQLLDETATVYKFSVTPHFAELFVSAAQKLDDWKHPDLPEDPAFYREDGSLLFGSISHERDAFLMLLDGETVTDD